jgi:hypothetical protein
MTDEEFFRYWKEIHGPIGARIPGLRRLVQSHRTVVVGDKYQPDYDGMAELWGLMMWRRCWRPVKVRNGRLLSKMKAIS